MSEHTKEPWFYQKESVGNYQIAHDHSGAETLEVTANAITEANARRIVACVNACAGIDTEFLENVMVQPVHVAARERLSAYTKRIERQRDELLAALKKVIPHIDTSAVDAELIRAKPVNECYLNTICIKLVAKVENEK